MIPAVGGAAFSAAVGACIQQKGGVRSSRPVFSPVSLCAFDNSTWPTLIIGLAHSNLLILRSGRFLSHHPPFPPTWHGSVFGTARSRQGRVNTVRRSEPLMARTVPDNQKYQGKGVGQRESKWAN
jgi:hypothetical protein